MTNIDLLQLSIYLLEFIGIVFTTYAIFWETLLKRYKRWLNFKHFAKVFGNSAKVPQNIMIILPEWHLVDEENRNQKRFVKTLLDPKDKEFTKFHDPSVTIAYKDLDSVRHILTEINKVHSGYPVNFCLDNNQVWRDRESKTMILIGSIVANAHYRHLTKLKETPHFEQYFTKKQMGSDRSCYPAAVAYRDKHTGIEFHSVDKLPTRYGEGEKRADKISSFKSQKQTQDSLLVEKSTAKNISYFSVPNPRHYALISRFPNPLGEGGHFFLIEGPHAQGTLAAAEFFSHNWKEFINAEPEASILIEMIYMVDSDARIVKRYGFPEIKESTDLNEYMQGKPKYSNGVIFPDDNIS